MALRHPHVIDQRGAAERRPLTEARPIVDHGEAGRIAVGDRIPGAALIVQGNDGDEMSEQRAGRIEFFAGHDHMVTLVNKGRLEIGGAFRPEFGEGVAEAHALDHVGEEFALLLWLGHGTNGGNDAEMVLRNLAEARIGSGYDLDHLGKDGVRDLGTPERLRHVDRPKTALRKGVELRDRLGPRTVTLRGAGGETFRQCLGDFDRFALRTDDVSGTLRARQAGDSDRLCVLWIHGNRHGNFSVG